MWACGLVICSTFMVALTLGSDVSLKTIPVLSLDLLELGHTVYKRDTLRSANEDANRSPSAKGESLNSDYHGLQVKISHVESDTSWIEVQWSLLDQSKVNHSVSFKASCELDKWKIVSDRLNVSTSHFRFSHLMADTEYLICVETSETLANDSSASYTQITCANFFTIPIIRLDSLVAVILTLGYFVGLGVIGCVAWCHRARKRSSNQTSAVHQDGLELVFRKTSGRPTEVEERTHLNASDSETKVNCET